MSNSLSAKITITYTKDEGTESKINSEIDIQTDGVPDSVIIHSLNSAIINLRNIVLEECGCAAEDEQSRDNSIQSAYLIDWLKLHETLK